MTSASSTLVHFCGQPEQRPEAMQLLSAALAPACCIEVEDGRVRCDGDEAQVSGKLALLSGWKVWVSPEDEQRAMDQLAGALAMTSGILMLLLVMGYRLTMPYFFEQVPFYGLALISFVAGILIGLTTSTLVLPRRPRWIAAMLSVRLRAFSK